ITGDRGKKMLHDAARALLAAGYETAKDPQPTADAYPAGSRTAYRRAQKKTRGCRIFGGEAA
ncbi:MAG: hypothetical protein LUE95_06460, partial [Oscillospiraceae bacterium]|nr:hypothetical protein [Oscillospiraceae bacterium]